MKTAAVDASSGPGPATNTFPTTAGRAGEVPRVVEREQVARSRHHDMDSEGAVEPFVDLPTRTTPPRAAVLVLHGGKAESRGPVEPRQLTVRRMQPFVRSISSLGGDLAVGQIRYRYRGWNEAAADAVADVEFALVAIGERYGPVPVVLVGHSMGGRAALQAAGHSRVRGVVALAPWLPDTDPVEQFGGS